MAKLTKEEIYKEILDLVKLGLSKEEIEGFFKFYEDSLEIQPISRRTRVINRRRRQRNDQGK